MGGLSYFFTSWFHFKENCSLFRPHFTELNKLKYNFDYDSPNIAISIDSYVGDIFDINVKILHVL